MKTNVQDMTEEKTLKTWGWAVEEVSTPLAVGGSSSPSLLMEASLVVAAALVEAFLAVDLGEAFLAGLNFISDHVIAQVGNPCS